MNPKPSVNCGEQPATGSVNSSPNEQLGHFTTKLSRETPAESMTKWAEDKSSKYVTVACEVSNSFERTWEENELQVKLPGTWGWRARPRNTLVSLKPSTPLMQCQAGGQNMSQGAESPKHKMCVGRKTIITMASFMKIFLKREIIFFNKYIIKVLYW